MFTKLYGSLLTSSVWCEDASTRLLWITLMAAADRDGFVFGSPIGLANLARIPVEDAVQALQKFCGPDTMSSDLMRNPEGNGRRLEPVDGGFKILNYEYYRELKRSEDRKTQYRESKRRQRAKKVDGPQLSPKVSESHPSEAEADADTEAKKKSTVARRFAPPSLEAVLTLSREHGDPEDEATRFHAYFTSNGWKVGHNPMKNWKAAYVNWMLRK